ncbi:MAG: hypothetical protein K5893_03635 [Prevotella sp.]|nr:hypothetical protein [Prevotella sp.]
MENRNRQKGDSRLAYESVSDIIDSNKKKSFVQIENEESNLYSPFETSCDTSGMLSKPGIIQRNDMSKMIDELS